MRVKKQLGEFSSRVRTGECQSLGVIVPAIIDAIGKRYKTIGVMFRTALLPNASADEAEAEKGESIIVFEQFVGNKYSLGYFNQVSSAALLQKCCGCK